MFWNPLGFKIYFEDSELPLQFYYCKIGIFKHTVSVSSVSLFLLGIPPVLLLLSSHGEKTKNGEWGYYRARTF
jgi:hypothetical protein